MSDHGMEVVSSIILLRWKIIYKKTYLPCYILEVMIFNIRAKVNILSVSE